MRSMQLAGLPGAPSLSEENTPRPEPQPGELLVRIFAAGVTPTELSWYPTSHQKNGEKRTGAVLAHEFSGEIAELGTAAGGVFSLGQEVYGMNDWFAEGALAEYCITRPEWIAPKPSNLDHVKAATVPISALTAWQGLFDRARLQTGERLLVQGGAGAVGSYVIQLARSRGAHIIATVSSDNAEFVKELGADEVIDYQAAPFETVVNNVDVVFDGVGGETLQRSWSVLNPNGRLVTIAAASEAASDAQTAQAFFIVEPRQEQLVEIGKRLDTGELNTFVSKVLPLSQAAEAYTGPKEKKGRGKTVVTVVSR